MAAARAGYRVLLTYLSDKTAAEGVVQRIRAAGGFARAVQADTSKDPDIQRMFLECDAMGRLAVFVYNAGITGPSSTLLEATTETLSRVVDINLLGALVGAREAIRRMSTSAGGKGGSIVFISSRAATLGSPGQHVWYAASKGGLDSLTLGLARELGTQGIRVNAVSPGPINTGIHPPGRLESIAPSLPMRRAGEPEEVASAVMYLVSDGASYVSGANIAVAGGR